MMGKKIAVCLVGFISLSSGVAWGDTLMYSDWIPLNTTNWNLSVTVPKFDGSLGTLTKITFDLMGDVEGSARFESLDAAPATVTMDLSAQITLQRPDLSPLVVTLPTASTLDNVTAFDGVIDFGGTSGKTYPLLTASDADSAMLLSPFSPIDTANFIGGPLDTITLPVKAQGASTGSGAGNLLLQFATQAAANVQVTYEYIPIPEPAAASLLGLIGLVLLRRRR